MVSMGRCDVTMARYGKEIVGAHHLSAREYERAHSDSMDLSVDSNMLFGMEEEAIYEVGRRKVNGYDVISYRKK